MALGIAGLRIGEVLGMHADRITLDRREVVIDRQAQPVKGKGMVLTSPEGRAGTDHHRAGHRGLELRRHLRGHDGGPLFPGASNGLLRPTTFYAEAWQPALEGAELAGRFKFHALRHFCASTLLAEGAPVTAAAGCLGDTVQTVSQTYAHWLRDDRDVPADVLDRVLAPNSGVTAVSRAEADGS